MYNECRFFFTFPLLEEHKPIKFSKIAIGLEDKTPIIILLS